jgi:hypothetical protein
VRARTLSASCAADARIRADEPRKAPAENGPRHSGLAASEKNFEGFWRITETDLWGADALDMLEPAQISFGEHSALSMIAISAGLDCKYSGNRVEFSFLGDDDGSPLAGRGWAEVDDAGTLTGMLYIHDGDESGFVAKRSKPPIDRASPHSRRPSR